MRTKSEQTILWSLSKDIYPPPWQRKDYQAWLWWTFTTKNPLTTMRWFSFLQKDTPKNASCWSRRWRNTELKKDQIQHIFITVSLFGNLHRFTKVFYILMQKEWHFNFKKWDIKTRWLCWRIATSRFRGLEISNFSGQRSPRDPHNRLLWSMIFLQYF